MNVDQKETEVKKREILVSPPLFEAQSKQTSAAQGHCDRASVRGWSEMFTKKIEAGKHVIYTVRITAEQSHFSSFNRTQNRRESNSAGRNALGLHGGYGKNTGGKKSDFGESVILN